MSELHITDQAEADLEQAWEYVAQHNEVRPIDCWKTSWPGPDFMPSFH